MVSIFKQIFRAWRSLPVRWVRNSQSTMIYIFSQSKFCIKIQLWTPHSLKKILYFWSFDAFLSDKLQAIILSKNKVLCFFIRSIEKMVWKCQNLLPSCRPKHLKGPHWGLFRILILTKPVRYQLQLLELVQIELIFYSLILDLFCTVLF